MPLMDVVLYPDDPLALTAEPYENVGPEVSELAANMLQTMEANEGCGLAGPQVGLRKSILVLRNPETERSMCLVNPEISQAEGSEEGEEGCLSFPGLYATVERATRIRVRALDQNGASLDFEATGFLARIIQHETDHLTGIMFIDRLDILTREDKLEEWARIREDMAAALNGQPRGTPC